jgi:exodeoxyribonuclease VII small subunit
MAESSRPPRPVSNSAAASPAAATSGGGTGGEPSELEPELAFEQALDRLEAIVDRLEGGELALEEALARFEEGVRLSRRLSQQLAAAELRVERLLREGGELVTRPLEDPGREPGEG